MSRKNNDAKGEHTVIGFGTVIGGDITSEADILRIDGEVKGGINTKGDLVVGTNGIVRGDVIAANLYLGGQITGNAMISGKVDIEASGRLIGDVSTRLLSIDEKAVVQGRVSMTEAEAVPESEPKKAGMAKVSAGALATDTEEE